MLAYVKGYNTASFITFCNTYNSKNLFVLPGWLLFEHIDDVFHQEVSLQSINSMSVQHHLMPAGWASETASRRKRAASGG